MLLLFGCLALNDFDDAWIDRGGVVSASHLFESTAVVDIPDEGTNRLTGVLFDAVLKLVVLIAKSEGSDWLFLL